MKPEKGRIVKFKHPYPDEDPDQLYVVSEIHYDTEKPRAVIIPLNTDMQMPPSQIVNVSDIITTKISTLDLPGRKMTIVREDGTRIAGRVVSVKKKNTDAEMNIKKNEVFTNVELTVTDNKNNRHSGKLVISV